MMRLNRDRLAPFYKATHAAHTCNCCIDQRGGFAVPGSYHVRDIRSRKEFLQAAESQSRRGSGRSHRLHEFTPVHLIPPMCTLVILTIILRYVVPLNTCSVM